MRRCGCIDGFYQTSALDTSRPRHTPSRLRWQGSTRTSRFRYVLVSALPRGASVLLALFLSIAASATQWQAPTQDVLDVLHAPRLPWVWTAPSGEHMLMADPVVYPPLAEYAAGWHELAGIRVDPTVGRIHGRQGATSPRLVEVDGGAIIRLPLPDGAEVHGVNWTVDGERFALTVEHEQHLCAWVGDLEGELDKIDGVELNPLLGSAVQWMPDQKRLLLRQVPERGPEPTPPAIPVGPKVLEGSGDTARSTYESRNLLKTAHDDALFEYFATSQLLIVDPRKDKRTPIGEAAIITTASPSPDGRYLLVERLVGPWSHAVPVVALRQRGGGLEPQGQAGRDGGLAAPGRRGAHPRRGRGSAGCVLARHRPPHAVLGRGPGRRRSGGRGARTGTS